MNLHNNEQRSEIKKESMEQKNRKYTPFDYEFFHWGLWYSYYLKKNKNEVKGTVR